MSKKCTLCGGIVAFVGKNVFGEDVYECMLCKEPGHHSKFDDVTLFTEITKSPEVLVEKLYIEMALFLQVHSLKKCLILVKNKVKIIQKSILRQETKPSLQQ
jgi:hypothetical protein